MYVYIVRQPRGSGLCVADREAVRQVYLAPTEPLSRRRTTIYRTCSYIILSRNGYLLTMFVYRYGTRTLFFPTCSDRVQTNLP